jgi:hypothetical protein
MPYCSDRQAECHDVQELVSYESPSEVPTPVAAAPAADALTRGRVCCCSCYSYCFVCDVPASECSRWEDPIGNEAELSEDGQRLAIAKTSHCLAADKTEEWVQVRKAGKHAWLKESPLYAHLGGQCYGASADYTVTGLLAFEGFTVS